MSKVKPVIEQAKKPSSIAATQEEKRPRKRSPNYPVLNLETAIQRARTLYDQDAAHFMPITLSQERWGYKPFSSVADQAIAAIKAYGLIDVDGEGKKRRVRVSAAGERIIRAAPNRDELVREAALRPAIHRELWTRYGQSGLPSDQNIRAYLEWDREAGTFNADVVDGVITRFRETIEFANLRPGDIIRTQDAVSVEGEDSESQSADEASKAENTFSADFGRGSDGSLLGNMKMPKETKRMEPTVKEEVFVLDNGQIAIRWPAIISKESLQDIKDWLKILERKIGRCVQDEPKQEQ